MPSCHRAFMGISWVQLLSPRYFVGPKCFLVDKSLLRNFFSWLFRRCKIFFLVAKFLIQRFSVVGCMRKSDDRKQKYINTSQTTHSISNRNRNYCKITCPIVSLIIQNSPYPPPAKILSSFFNFSPIQRPKTLSLRGSEYSPNIQFLGSMFTA